MPGVGFGYSADELAAMQRAVLNLFERWGLTDQQAAVLLGGVSTKSLSRWRKGQLGRPGIDLGDRLSHLLGIHKALRITFSDPMMLVRTASSGKNSQLGTCFRAAA